MELYISIWSNLYFSIIVMLMKLLGILDATPFPIGYRISFLTNFWREPLLRWMERDTGLIRPELTVLMCLSFQKDLNARDICEITEQPSNTVSRAVTSLSDKGLISRVPDTVDTRRRVLNITEEGQAVHDRLMARFAEAEKVMLETLSKQEVETLEHLLDKLARDVPRWRQP
ncbi:MAG: MarR family winged helix-turn-helix transcriptional regulator [Roseibium album]|uniref:Transcriptional regulator SlyA n=2 Tax=Roseibium album TaxID=311410 RepID=A0A0M6Z6K7_9HYPH|nr:MarR family winged helix-turn-helix transcriptional regulator [Roseibium album]CTQ57760.1 transcriptional regulator SlyA [Roseibium album]CTQ68395.1 transcriptional regulator SlyA [Roseibium album]CTQ70691.1 transcriptional regulator SlyA [Roseibium album]